MIRSWAVVFVAMVAIASAGCSGGEAGTPRPVGPTSSGSASTPSSTGGQENAPLLGLDPCALITSDEVRELGAAEPGEREDLASSRGCGWTVSGSHSFGVAFWDTKGIDDLALTGRRVPVTIEGRLAERLEENSGPGYCAVIFPITESSVASADVLADAGTATACEVAERVARLIAPKLP